MPRANDDRPLPFSDPQEGWEGSLGADLCRIAGAARGLEQFALSMDCGDGHAEGHAYELANLARGVVLMARFAQEKANRIADKFDIPDDPWHGDRGGKD